MSTNGKPRGKKPLSDAEKAKRKAALASETKADKFRRIAKMRVPKAIGALRVIGNLSGSGYEYTPAQVNIIADALRTATESAIDKFQDGLNRSGGASKIDFEI